MPLLVAWQHTPTHLQLEELTHLGSQWVWADLQSGCQLVPGQPWGLGGLEGLGLPAPPSVLRVLLLPRMGPPQGLLLQQVSAW